MKQLILSCACHLPDKAFARIFLICGRRNFWIIKTAQLVFFDYFRHVCSQPIMFERCFITNQFIRFVNRSNITKVKISQTEAGKNSCRVWCITGVYKDENFVKCCLLIGGGIFGLVAFSYSQSASQSAKTVTYPEVYRRWVHINSRVVGPESPAFKRYGGLHNIYGNQQAMEGFKTGHFPNSSMIVFDQLEAQTKNGVISGGARRFIDVMQKDSNLFTETGGWGFEEFSGDSHMKRALNEQAKTTCFTYHAGQKVNDSVFSIFHE